MVSDDFLLVLFFGERDPLLPAGHQTIIIHVHDVLLDSILEVFLHLRDVSDPIP